LLLSLVFVAPLLVEFLRPVVSSVKLGAVELSFREVAERTAAMIEEFSDVARFADAPIESMATSYYGDILAQLDHFNEVHAAVVRVHLGSEAKRTWKVPNLYFLALLLERRSGVRQLVFIHERPDGLEGFITMCAPGDLRRDLERLAPPLAAAAAKWTHAQAQSIPQQPQPNVAFSNALREAITEMSDPAKGIDANATYQVFLDGFVQPQGLLAVLGLDVNLCRLRWKERLARDDYRAILACTHPYVAVTQDGRLVSVLDQHRLALAVARRVA
jgi:hypothetical protein